MDRTEVIAILLLLLLALFLRELDINRPLYGDEADWYKSALILVNGDQRWQNNYISDSPPLGKAVFVSFYALGFGDFRQVTVLFAMASLIVTYFMARDFMGRQSALLSLIVLATSAYAVVGAQHVDRDGGMLAFLSMLTFYGYLKYATSEAHANKWLGISLLAFLAAVLMRTNMVVLVVPLLVFEYLKVGAGSTLLRRLATAAKALAPFAVAFVLSFAIWLVLDSLMQLQTMSNTLAHYLTYATGSNQDLNSRLLRTAGSVGRVLARLSPPMALALVVSAYGLWESRKKISRKEAGLLAIMLAWIGVGAASALLVTQGNVPAYFAPTMPAIAIIVGCFCTRAEVRGLKWFAFALMLALAYAGLLGYIDFNEVNLLLLPAAGIGAFVLAAAYWLVDRKRGLARLAVVLLAMGMASSAFMLGGLRTYDAMRSQAVADAAGYFEIVGAQKIAESQERTLDLYVDGTVRQYAERGTCAMVDGRPCPPDEVANFPAGFYVVNFPLRPLALDPAVGAQFRFNLFYEAGVENCALERSYRAHDIVLSEIYRC